MGVEELLLNRLRKLRSITVADLLGRPLHYDLARAFR
jgi:hypothetical protein